MLQPHIASSPVSLSYVAALRGVKPRRPGEAFTYAEIYCRDPGMLICLAASNPEGRFYGLVADAALRDNAQAQARIRHVDNVAFLAATPAAILADMKKGAAPLPQLHYLHCDESEQKLDPAARTALFDLAQRQMAPGGLFHYVYRAYEGHDGHLRFLVREFAPEMTPAQAEVFLTELTQMGSQYFHRHPGVLAGINAAALKHMPDHFFAAYDEGEARSATFETIVALRPRGFAYAGDGEIAANYVELSLPPSAQDTVIKCHGNPLYEPIKDYALDRPVRSDIWCRMPARQTASPAERFGGFAYGIIKAREDIPAIYKARGKDIDLTPPLFTKLIELMTLMPVTVGDFLAHPLGKEFKPQDVVEAIQVLVACGLAQPMRGVQQANDVTSITQPRLVGGFNQYLGEMPVTGSEVWMASPVAGNALLLSPRDALVLQALARAGLANSVSALLPELQRLAKNPSQAARVMDVTEPTAEMAHHMIEEVVKKSIVQWYAYGVLEAA